MPPNCIYLWHWDHLISHIFTWCLRFLGTTEWSHFEVWSAVGGGVSHRREQSEHIHDSWYAGTLCRIASSTFLYLYVSLLSALSTRIGYTVIGFPYTKLEMSWAQPTSVSTNTPWNGSNLKQARVKHVKSWQMNSYQQECNSVRSDTCQGLSGSTYVPAIRLLHLCMRC